MGVSTTIEDMVKEYAKKIDLPEDYLGKEVMFLYTGTKLDFKSKQTIGSMFSNNATISVFDIGNIIGCWTIHFVASSGSKISMKIDESKTIKDMMESYARRVRVPKESIGENIKFLFNGENLDSIKNDLITRVLKNGTTITVDDMNDVIHVN